MSAPTVGLALVVRDEERNLPRLLASIEGAFDRVVLLDTGSKDRTVELFGAWAREQTGMTYQVGRFEWINDFAAARNVADHLLCWGHEHTPYPGLKRPLVDWTCWADADDTIVNARELRGIAEKISGQAPFAIFGYDYAQHPDTGDCICHLKRERLVRAEQAGQWIGRVHEAQVVQGAAITVPDAVCHWRHHKQESPETIGRSNGRNLKILRAWVRDEPMNTRVLAYLGTELAIQGKPARTKQAIGYFKRYLKANPTWDEEHAQVCRKLAACLFQFERLDEARDAALQAVAVRPDWPDSYLTLAEVALAQGEPHKALIHARRVLEAGVPDTMLIVSPLDYLVHPHRLMAGAHGLLGDWETAARHCEEVLRHEPGDLGIRREHFGFVTKLEREHTADTYVMAAQQLVRKDEQVKALTLLEDVVPHFAYDHPKVVAARSELRERLMWAHAPETFAEHYQTGGSKPEDFIPDERIKDICEALPRVHFLVNGLAEQAEAA